MISSKKPQTLFFLIVGLFGVISLVSLFLTVRLTLQINKTSIDSEPTNMAEISNLEKLSKPITKNEQNTTPTTMKQLLGLGEKTRVAQPATRVSVVAGLPVVGEVDSVNDKTLVMRAYENNMKIQTTPGTLSGKIYTFSLNEQTSFVTPVSDVNKKITMTIGKREDVKKGDYIQVNTTDPTLLNQTPEQVIYSKNNPYTKK